MSLMEVMRDEEAKFIVYESCLRQLFETCPVCKTDCEVQERKSGTFVAFTQRCPQCQYQREWESQPIVNSTPLGDLQLSAASYFTGTPFTQLEKLCQALKLQILESSTFISHSREYLEPAIVHKWKRDQWALLQEQKDQSEPVAVAGDVRIHSTGDSTKLGSCAFLNLKSNTILDVQLVQSGEEGQSCQIEQESLKRCLDHLESSGLQIDYIITDRQPHIETFLKDRNVKQFYDSALFVKGLSQKLDEATEDEDCKVLRKWLPSIKNHVYWCAASSTSGAEKVAKWTSLVDHMHNIHEHEDPLYPKCLHPVKVSRSSSKWLKGGTLASYKADMIMLNEQALKDMERLGYYQQTPAMEKFRTLSTQSAPKTTAFSFIGTLCRLYVAAMQYNETASKEESTTSAGDAVKTDVTLNYAQDLMLLLMKVLKDPAPFAEEIQKISDPSDLPSLLEQTAVKG